MITTVLIFGQPGGWIAHFKASGGRTVRGVSGRTPELIAQNVCTKCRNEGTTGGNARLEKELGGAISIQFFPGGEVRFNDLEGLIATYLELME